MKRCAVVLTALSAVIVLAACEAVEKAAESIIEQQTGCTDQQLGNLDEPAMPNCSKAAACCMYIQGKCGTEQPFEFPAEVVAACQQNESVLKTAIEEYQGIAENDCPEYLNPDACTEGLDKTKENYVGVVDKGETDKAGQAAPSCKLIVDETIGPLNDELGDQAKYLPKACEAGTGNTSEPPADEDVIGIAE